MNTSSGIADKNVNIAMRQAALRRNLGTAAVLALAVSGGPFGMGWLAATTGSSFLLLMLVRLGQIRTDKPELKEF